MFEQRGRIIRDGAPLDYKFVPDVLVDRRDKLDELEVAFRPLFFSGTHCCAYIHGHVGSGKTVTALRFCDDMKDAFAKAGKVLDVIPVNCRIRASEYAVLLEMVRFYDKGFPDRGFSVDEMFSSFKKHVNDGSHPVVILLDEVDAVLSDAGRNIVYQLTRASDDMSQGASISLIMISQKSLDQLSLDMASRSTFGRSGTVEFDGYGLSSLKGIIEQRVDKALYPGVIDEECIGLIASNAVPYGDARFAIETLVKAANLAEQKGDDAIRREYIQKAGASEHTDYTESKVRELNFERKLVLLSVARSLFKSADVSMSHVEGTYAAACEEYGVPVKKHTQFYTYVTDLEKRSFVQTEVRRGPEGGRVTYISILNVPPRDLAEILESMICAERREVSQDEM